MRYNKDVSQESEEGSYFLQPQKTLRANEEELPTFTFTPEILAGLAEMPQPPDDYFDYDA